jgi:formylglycine-generating enzyme required for sulfatase activity
MRDTIIFVWMIVTLAACVPQGGEQQETIAVNPLDGECYVWIPPGTYQMGCSSDDRDCQDEYIKFFSHEKPRHQVTISKGFWMSQTEVTIGAYRKFANATHQKMPEELVLAAPQRFQWSGFPQSDDYPIAYVTWEDARQYCEWAGGRLPTEAEWEYAARAGCSKARYGNINEIAWYGDNSGPSKLNSAELREIASSPADYGKRLRNNGNDSHPVAKKAPNDFGLYDMLGNVYEYCSDWYGEKYYQVSEQRDPDGPPSGEAWIMRGGSWRDPPQGVRVSIRNWMIPDHRFDFIGIRCVLDEIPKPRVSDSLFKPLFSICTKLHVDF